MEKFPKLLGTRKNILWQSAAKLRHFVGEGSETIMGTPFYLREMG